MIEILQYLGCEMKQHTDCHILEVNYFTRNTPTRQKSGM